MSPRFALAAAALALVSACSTGSKEERATPPPAAAADAPVSGSVVGASGVTFGDRRPAASGGASGGAATAGAVEPDRIESANPNEIVTVGTPDKPAESPDGDPRNALQRRQDRAQFDRCVMRATRQGAQSSANPVDESPEEYCSRRLGMSSRDAIPASRR